VTLPVNRRPCPDASLARRARFASVCRRRSVASTGCAARPRLVARRATVRGCPRGWRGCGPGGRAAVARCAGSPSTTGWCVPWPIIKSSPLTRARDAATTMLSDELVETAAGPLAADIGRLRRSLRGGWTGSPHRSPDATRRLPDLMGGQSCPARERREDRLALAGVARRPLASDGGCAGGPASGAEHTVTAIAVPRVARRRGGSGSGARPEPPRGHAARGRRVGSRAWSLQP
jgi:hypothetical protein